MRVNLIDVEPDDYGLAARVAKWMLKQASTQKDGILAFGDGTTVDFYVKRTKSGMSIRRISRGEKEEASQ